MIALCIGSSALPTFIARASSTLKRPFSARRESC